MIVFFTKNAEEIALSAIIKHFNPGANLRFYESNEDILKIAKMHNEPTNFIRIKDYKLAIINRYDFPKWIKDDLKIKFLEYVIANKNTNIYSLINHLAQHLFSPEKLFYGVLDKSVMFKDFAMQTIREVKMFKKLVRKFEKNNITYHEINPKHDILRLYAKSILKTCKEPFIVLSYDEAILMNAKQIGFNFNEVLMPRADALSIKIKKQLPIIGKKIVKKTIATKISEF